MDDHIIGLLVARLEDHAAEDRRRFDSQDTVLAKIDKNVASLMESRAFTRGVGKTVAAAAGSGGLVSLIFEIWRRLHA
jgi:hypothetical protein